MTPKPQLDHNANNKQRTKRNKTKNCNHENTAQT
jgi:hypothetical protein